MIDENKLIDDLQEKVFHNATDEFYGAMQCIDEQPQLNQWHVVADGDLPEEGGYYLVTYHSWSDGEYLPKYDNTYVRRLHYQNCDSFIGWNYPKCLDDKAEKDSHKEVIAWMELPQPYKERD